MLMYLTLPIREVAKKKYSGNNRYSEIRYLLVKKQ